MLQKDVKLETAVSCGYSCLTGHTMTFWTSLPIRYCEIKPGFTLHTYKEDY